MVIIWSLWLIVRHPSLRLHRVGVGGRRVVTIVVMVVFRLVLRRRPGIVIMMVVFSLSLRWILRRRPGVVIIIMIVILNLRFGLSLRLRLRPRAGRAATVTLSGMTCQCSWKRRWLPVSPARAGARAVIMPVTARAVIQVVIIIFTGRLGTGGRGLTTTLIMNLCISSSEPRMS